MANGTRPTGPVRGWRSLAFSAAIFAFLLVFVGAVAGLLAADALYIDISAVYKVLQSEPIRAAAWLSLWTTTLATAISVMFAVPIGYALRRDRGPGQVLVDTLVDLPIVFPPLVMGLSLLVFFRTPMGMWIESSGFEFIYQRSGIVLAQVLVAASFGIRTIKSTFDDIDHREEDVALTLGCSRGQAFWHVAVPNARGGIIAGAILTWARAFGIFGPLMVFVGAVRMRTEVLATTVYLEASVGHIDVALAVALLMVAIAAVALVLIRCAGRRRLL